MNILNIEMKRLKNIYFLQIKLKDFRTKKQTILFNFISKKYFLNENYANLTIIWKINNKLLLFFL